MKRSLLIGSLLIITSLQLCAQYEPADRKGKFFLIPEFWLSFGYSTHIEVAPQLGYHVNDRLSLGMGPHYIYQSWKSPAAQTHVYGLKGFARFSLITNAEQFLPFNLFNDLFAQLEYEGMSLENGIYNWVGDNTRYTNHLFLVGGGILQRIGMYNSVSFMVLWDLNETSGSPYSNPIFRIGFNTYF
ncbi:MAG: hypothetical protein ABFS10_06535 [Bacteroidota bacterium]